MNTEASEIENENLPESAGYKLPRSRASDVLARLRRDISESRFLPGERLHMEELSRIYGAGFSPIREALSHLAAEELVVLAEYKGYRVAPVSSQDWLDILMMRCELESLGLALSIERGDETWVASVKDCLAALSQQEPPVRGNKLNPEWEKCHQAFHRSLIAACGSPWLIKFSNQLTEQSTRYLSLSLVGASQEFHGHVSDHMAIAEAVVDGDANLATALLRSHLNRTKKLLLNASADMFSDIADAKSKPVSTQK